MTLASRKLKPLAILLAFFLTLPAFVAGQLPLQEQQYRTSADLWLGLQRLRTLGTVLYVAAHPDDENTRLISWLTHQQHCRTAYMSLTRGDGGQNLIGEEIEEPLGVIRTQELLSARRIDRGEQYFSRAYDFGYSKTADETFRIWDREQTLEELVLLIRSLKPDLIITRFSTEPGGTHGHHTASAILAVEAYEAAADPKRFPDQLKTLKPWKAKRVVWNTSPFFFRERGGFKPEGFMSVDIGAYITAHGESVTEIAARSRSQHKSQGFGTVGERGETLEYFQHLAGQQAQKGLFEGVDMSWNRLPDGVALHRLAESIITEFNASAPEAIVPKLAQFYKRLETLEDSEWKRYKRAEVRALIAGCLGLYMHAAVSKPLYAPGDSVALNFEVIQRRGKPALLRRVSLPEFKADSAGTNPLRINFRALWNPKLVTPALPATQPFWLIQETREGMFVVEDKSNFCLPENLPTLTAQAELVVEGEPITWNFPVTYRQSDPVRGEVIAPAAIGYPVYLSMMEPVRIFSGANEQTLRVKVTAGQANVNAGVRLRLPQGWQAEPREHRVNLKISASDTILAFRVRPPAAQGSGQIVAEAQVGDRVYDRGKVVLDYDHIHRQTIFPIALTRAIRADVRTLVNEIGYIEGAGDQVDESLRQFGLEVITIKPSDITLENLKRYKAIVVGVRAYNTVKELAGLQPVLMAYVRQGGTLVVQYNTNRGLVTENFAPYTLKLTRDRVTDERAEMQLLDPSHSVFNKPNAIGASDFQGWVQERGLYFVGESAKEFTPLISCADPGEQPLKGSLMYARYGEGHFIYTGLSFFRQLPSGVPGAYKLFMNLISVGL